MSLLHPEPEHITPGWYMGLDGDSEVFPLPPDITGTLQKAEYQTHIPVEHALSPQLTHFMSLMKERFHITEKQEEQLQERFDTCFLIAQQLNAGKPIEGLPVTQENELLYHDWAHTVHVTERTMQILPGFLERLQKKGFNVQENFWMVEATLLAAINHEDGYLLLADDNPAYAMQAALYFDHVQRSVDMGSTIVQRLGYYKKRSRELTFFKNLILWTDFNANDAYKKLLPGMRSNYVPWGQLLRNADLLGTLALDAYVPDIVQELYIENSAPIVVDGKVKTFEWDANGKLVFEFDGKLGRPRPRLVTSKDPLNDYGTIQELNFYERDKPEIDGKRRVNEAGIHAFVASGFMAFIENTVQPNIDDAQLWFGDGLNEIGARFAENKRRVEVLQQEATNGSHIDPFMIFEGSFSGHILALAIQELRDRQMLKSGDFYLDEGSCWIAVDRRIIWPKRHDTDIFRRLATGEIRQVIRAVKNHQRSHALSVLLELIREQTEGEGVEEVHINIAANAYVGEKGYPFRSLSRAIDVIARGFEQLPAKEGFPQAGFVLTIRRDLDFLSRKTGLPDPDKMIEMAQTVNDAYRNGQITGITFMGREGRLEDYGEFFNALDRDIHMVILAGQTFPHAEETDEAIRARFTQNMTYICKLAKQFNHLTLWGLQDLRKLTPQELDVINRTLPNSVKVIATLTFDQVAHLVDDITRHPLALLRIPGLEASIGTANKALTRSGSIPLDLLRLLSRQNVPFTSLRNMLDFNGRDIYRPLKENPNTQGVVHTVFTGGTRQNPEEPERTA